MEEISQFSQGVVGHQKWLGRPRLACKFATLDLDNIAYLEARNAKTNVQNVKYQGIYDTLGIQNFRL